jgi:uncharacterized protein YkwD
MRQTFGVVSALCLALLAAASLSGKASALELPCRHEDALAEAAAELLLAGGKLDGGKLLARVRASGFDGVSVHAHEGLEDGPIIQWLKALGERSDGPLVCGEAVSETRRMVLVSSRGGTLWRENGKVRGSLEPGFARPHLVVETAEGTPKRIEVTTAQLEKGVALAAELGAKRVQLIAEGPSGPRPVSELSLMGEAKTVQPVLTVSADEADAPRGPRSRPLSALFARLDGFRSERGVGTLRPNNLLSGSAQRHAERVCELGRVAHRLDGSDDPETRLREEHIAARSVGEAVARAGSADAALAAVLDSPSHRMAISERGFTDAGLGQATDSRGNTCLVVLLAAWPRRIP